MARCKIFGVYDKVAECLTTVGLSSTAGCFAREIGKLMVRANPNFEKETCIVELGEFNESHLLDDFETISWDIYAKPEIPATPMDNPDLAFAPVKS